VCDHGLILFQWMRWAICFFSQAIGTLGSVFIGKKCCCIGKKQFRQQQCIAVVIILLVAAAADDDNDDDDVFLRLRNREASCSVNWSCLLRDFRRQEASHKLRSGSHH